MVKEQKVFDILDKQGRPFSKSPPAAVPDVAGELLLFKQVPAGCVLRGWTLTTYRHDQAVKIIRGMVRPGDPHPDFPKLRALGILEPWLAIADAEGRVLAWNVSVAYGEFEVWT